MRISERNALTAVQRDKFDRQLAFVLEHRPEIPKLATRVQKMVSCSQATVYGVLSGNLYSTKVISALYAIATEHLGISAQVGENPSSLGINIANEEDRIMLEKLVTAREHRSAVSDSFSSLLLAIRSYERSILSAQLSDAEISTRFRLLSRKLSPDTLTEVHEYLSATSQATPPISDILPPDLPDRPILLSASAEETATLSTIAVNGISESSDYFDQDTRIWRSADGTALEPIPRNKYPDN